LVVEIAALAAIGVPEVYANTAIFTNSGTVCTLVAPCANAGAFGIIADPGVAVQENNGNITGNIGIGTGGSYTNTGPSTVTGAIDFADPVGSNYNISNTTVTGGAVRNQTLVNNAIAEYTAISNYWAGISGSSLSLGYVNGYTLDATGGGAHVYNVGSVRTRGAGMVINGGVNDLVILNISGSTVDFQAPVTLSGGITSDQVLFNIRSSGTNLTSSGAAGNVYGTLIDLSGNVNLTSVTIYGRIFGGYSSLQFVSGFNLMDPPEIQCAVPEPSQWVPMITGLGIVGLVSLWRRATRT
jgi:hypothetical protein